MTDNLKQLRYIEERLRVFFDNHQEIKRQLEALKKECERLRQENQRLSEAIAEKEQQLAVVRLAKTFSEAENDHTIRKEELKKKIEAMIKEIDNCVSLLNQ